MIQYIKKILYLLPKGDSVKLVILFFMMLLAALLEVAGIGMIPAFVSIVADPEQVMQFAPIERLLATLGITTSRELLIWGGVTLVFVFVVKNLYMAAYFYIEARYTYSRFYSIAHRLMSSYMQAPYTFHLQRNSAELLRNANQEVRLMVQQVMKQMLVMAKETVMVTGILLFLLILEPLITLATFAVLGSSVGMFLMLTQKRVKRYGLEEQKHRRGMIKALNQGVGGIKDARILNREADFIEHFRHAAFRSSRLLAIKEFLSKLPKPMVETIAVGGVMLIAVLMVVQGRPVSAIIPVLTLFAMATMRLMPAIQQITRAMTQIRYNLVAIDPIYDDIRELSEYRKRFLADRDQHEQLSMQHNLDAENVHYSYPNSEEQALRGVSFAISRGSSVAFTGPSGSGKTTIVDLLLGLLEPTKGEIRVDGKNIHDHLSGWQRNIGYIPQFIYLADETLRSNIAFGIPAKEIDDEKVWQAIRLAQLDELVHRLPKELDTMIGERGTRLSGGQRQRVGIARALYHDPDVLVMDEATSALDNIVEKQIIEAIEALKGDRTIIMIAHRLTTVMNCDHIYLLDNGKITKEGNYRHLIDSSQKFREMAMEKK